jgi:hypothetical protein
VRKIRVERRIVTIRAVVNNVTGDSHYGANRIRHPQGIDFDLFTDRILVRKEMGSQSFIRKPLVDRDNRRTFVRSLPTGAFKQPETNVISRLAKLKLAAIVVEVWIKCEHLSPKFPPSFPPHPITRSPSSQRGISVE